MSDTTAACTHCGQSYKPSHASTPKECATCTGLRRKLAFFEGYELACAVQLAARNRRALEVRAAMKQLEGG